MGYAGYAFFPDNGDVGGNVWIGRAQAGAEWDYYRPNLILHETLHALGLKHPFDGANVLPTEANIIPNTVMSYSPAAGASSGALSRYPVEPMALDVLALQALYGAAANNTGDTSYNLADASFRNFRVLWDTSGSDTLDASACLKGVRLDLAAGAHSDVGSSITAFAYTGTGAGRTYAATSYTDTLSIAQGSSIENATGSALDDLLLGSEGDNVLSGGDGNDVLDGRGGNDQLYGGRGNDTIRVTIGNKQIDGGAGDDTVVFAGSVREFSIAESAGGYTVNRLSNPTSVINLRNVEHLEFSDASMAPQQTVNAGASAEAFTGQAFRLYKAALNRLPDKAGLEFQADALGGGLSLAQLASNFMASPEFTTRFNVAENSKFVTLLYNNVLGRAPDAPGLQYHLDHLNSQLTRADVLVGFSESPENQAAVVGVGGVWPTL
jgi:serralysin